MNSKIVIIIMMMTLSASLFAQTGTPELMKANHEQYDIVTHKMDIIPGIWRPMFGSEQVAWISPPWESEEYIWIDFPEAIFDQGELMYLGHIDKRFPTLYPAEKSAPWRMIENGMRYEQVLPNGVSFDGEITQKGENTAALKISITNGSGKELKDVRFQTCVYMNGIGEFSEKTDENKFIHVPSKGWVTFKEAKKEENIPNGIGVGWLDHTHEVADLPVVVTKSKIEGHLIAITWFDNTYSFVGNPAHPCMHADPFCSNMKPGETQVIHGELIFFEGSIEEFEKMFRAKMKK